METQFNKPSETEAAGLVNPPTGVRAMTLAGRCILLAAVLLSLAIFAVVGKLFHIPTVRFFSGSLVQQPEAAIEWGVVFITYLLTVAIGTLIAGRFARDAGLLCASIGLTALSLRGGPMRYVLFDEPGKGVWIALLAELLLLSSCVIAGTILQRLLKSRQILFLEDAKDRPLRFYDRLPHKIASVGLNGLVIVVVMVLLAATDRKAQVLGATFIASFSGTLLAYVLIPTRSSAWYWVAPILVAFAGYFLAFRASQAGLDIGQIRMPLAALARPMPVDYLCAGIPGSIVACWLGRSWQNEEAVAA